MNFSQFAIDSRLASAEVTSFHVPNNSDSNAEYKLSIKLRSDPPKEWIIKRNYTEFEVYHFILNQKFDKTPYLPCRVLLSLREPERIERCRLIEAYLKQCIATPEIFNALETRLFLEFEKNSGVFVNTPIAIHSDLTSGKQLISGIYRPQNQELLLLHSVYQPESSGAISKIANTFMGFFSKKSSETQGNLFLGKDKLAGTFDFEKNDLILFEKDAPTAMNISESGLLLVVGFKSGQINSYTIDSGKLTKHSSAKVHNGAVKLLLVLEKEGVAISAGEDRSLSWVDLDRDDSYSDEITGLRKPASALFFNNKYQVLLMGNSEGNMTAYKTDSSRRGTRLKVVFQQDFVNMSISSIVGDSQGHRLFVGFESGVVDMFETGVGFESKPVWVGRWELLNKVRTLHYVSKPPTLIASHGVGLVTFCDALNPPKCITHMVLNCAVFLNQVFESDRTIFSVGEKGYSIWKFPETAFSDKLSKSRKLEAFDVSKIESVCLPNCPVFYAPPEQKPEVKPETPDDKKSEQKSKSKQKAQDSSDEDDMAGWND